MDGRSARASFARFLETLRDEIDEQYRQPGIRIKQHIDIGKTDTHGWCASLLYWPERKLRLEAWYDHFITKSQRSLWVGLRAHRNPMAAYFTRLSLDIRAEKLIDNDTVEHDAAGQAHYSGKVNQKRFEKLYSEEYGNTEMFAGRYFFGVAGFRSLRTLAGEVVGFLPVLLAGLRDADDDATTYRRVRTREGRRRVVKHMRQERDGAAPREAKKRDGYRCRVCDMRFADLYGHYGKRFAEAHHVVPLATRRGEYDLAVKDFISVCSNCHRMLHRMDGRRADWRDLRQVVQRHRQSISSSTPSSRP